MFMAEITQNTLLWTVLASVVNNKLWEKTPSFKYLVVLWTFTGLPVVSACCCMERSEAKVTSESNVQQNGKTNTNNVTQVIKNKRNVGRVKCYTYHQ